MQDYSYEIEVRQRLVSVHVLDKKKNHIKDLKLDDFMIFENGKRRDITYFEIIDKDDSSSLKPPQSVIQPIPINQMESIKKPESAKQHFIFFIDSGFTTRVSFDRLIQNVKQFLGNLDLTHLKIKLVHFDKEYKQLTPFTSSKEALIDAINDMNHNGVMRKKMEKLNFEILGSKESDPKAFLFKDSNYMLNQRLERKSELVSAYYSKILQCLIGATYILQPFQGSKHLLLFSGGGYRDNYGDLGNGSLEKLTGYLVKLLNTTGITLHSIRIDDGRPGVLFGEKRLLKLQQDLHFQRQKKEPGSSQRFKQMPSLPKYTSVETGGLSYLVKGENGAMLGLKKTFEYSKYGYLLGYALDPEEVGGKVNIKLTQKNRDYNLHYGKKVLDLKSFSKMKGTKRQMAFEAAFFYGKPTGDLPIDWRGDVIKLNEDQFATVFCGKLNRSGFQKIEIAGALLDENDMPIAFSSWEIEQSRKSFDHFYFVLSSNNPPSKLRIYYSNQQTGDYHLDQSEFRKDLDSPLSLVFLGQRNESSICLNQIPAVFQSHESHSNPFKLGDYFFIPSFDIREGEDFYSFFLLDKSADIGGSFFIDLTMELPNEVLVSETEILKIDSGKMNSHLVVSKHHFPENKLWSNSLNIKVSSESGMTLKTRINAHIQKDK